MQAGTPVCVVGLVGKPELNGEKGVVLRLHLTDGLPAAPDWRYCVRLAGGAELSLKVVNLTAPRAEAVREDVLTVDGLCYCAAHRAEICGKCGSNHRLENRVAELGAGGGAAALRAAARVDAAEGARIDVPPRRAPGAAAAQPAPGLGRQAPAPGRLDPAALPAWAPSDGPIDKAFHGAFSLREIVASHAANGGTSLHAGDAHFRLRQSLFALATALDGMAAAGIPNLRFMLQDDAQTECVCIDVIDIRKMSGGHRDVPVLGVSWFYATAAGGAAAAKIQCDSLRLLPPGTRFQAISSDVDEIALLRRLLANNAKNLDPAYVAAKSRGIHKAFKISVLQPVVHDAGETKDVHACANPLCAAMDAKHACVRCKRERYCGRACQKAHWSAHKVSCRAPVDVAAAVIIAVDLKGLTEMGMPGGQHALCISSDAPLSDLVDAAKAAGSSFGRAAPRAPNRRGSDKLFPVKVQIPIIPLSDEDFAMMVYDRTRKVRVQVTASNCTGWRQLATAVARQRQPKAYFNAYLTGEQLHIIASEMLPPQPW